uniref:Uncharacterized protein n=1 Tax=Brugia malayi TaxID=6279 RepID=A8PJP3_BRUMA
MGEKGTSALTVTTPQTHRKANTKISKTQRPRAFCSHHNTALCYTKYNDQARSLGAIEEDTKTAKPINPVIKHSTRNDRCFALRKEVEVINLEAVLKQRVYRRN